MCGIFLYIQKLKKISEEKKLNIKETFDKLKKRGPDNSKLIMISSLSFSVVKFH